MNTLDIIIIVVVAFQLFKWAQLGFARGFFSLAGFWVGVILGSLLSPFVMGLVESPNAKLIITLLLIFGFASIFGSVGRAIGGKLFHVINKIRLNAVDGILGATFSVFMSLGLVWIGAAILTGLPFQDVNRSIRDSTIIQALNATLPSPPAVIAKIGSLINPNNFPQAFLGPEPQPVAPVDPPSSEDIASALEAAGRSTVRIESIGCGGSLTGSGFIAKNGLVATNAHVVAGIDRPTIVDVEGRYDARVIYFDPRTDIAILQVDENMAGEPLAIAAEDVVRGTTAVTLGYPNGGPLKAVPAGVLRATEARGLTIYGDNTTVRPVYILQTTVISGNSGGPIVATDGTVLGMIFARSEAQEDIGYAIRSTAILQALTTVTEGSPTVDTLTCARD